MTVTLVVYLITGLIWAAVASTAGFIVYATWSLLRHRRRARAATARAWQAWREQQAKDRTIRTIRRQLERGIIANAERLIAETEAYLIRASTEEEAP